MQGAWKVGLLVLVFVGLLIGAYAVLGRAIFAPKTDLYYAEVPDATGVNRGGPVLMAGVKIGRIEDIQLVDPRRARIVLAIDQGQRIPEGTTALVPTPLLGFGDNPITLVPPVAVTTYLSPGATIAGSKASPFEGIFPDLGTTMSELNRTLIATRELMSDQKLKGRLEELLVTSSKAVEKLGNLAGSAETLVAENRASIKTAMASLSATMRDVQQGAKLATALLKDERWKNQADEMLTSLNRTASKAEELIASVNDLVNDPQLREPLRGTMANVQSMTDSGTRIAANTEEMTKHGVEISKNVEELTKKAIQLADEARDVLKKLQDFFNRVPSKAGLKGIETEMDLTRQTDPWHWRTDVSATVPISDGKLHVGLFDAFESNRIVLQFGKTMGRSLDLRYGVYASKPGAGVDFRFAPRLSLRGDLYDINDPTFDLRARYELGSGLIGWVGLDNVFEKNRFAVGLGIRK